MKKFFTSIIAVLFVVCGAITAQAAPSFEVMLKELNIPAAEAKALTDYVVANNISDATVAALVGAAQEVLDLIGNQSLSELESTTKELIITKVTKATNSIGLAIKIDGAKVALYKGNGEQLVSLATDTLENVVETTKSKLETTPNLLGDIQKRYIEERNLYNNNRPENQKPQTNNTNGSGITNNSTSTNESSATAPSTLNKTGFNAMPLVAGLAVIALGAGVFAVSRKINA